MPRAFFGIYGAGGCGRGIMPLARQMPSLADQTPFFIDDTRDGASVINGNAVVSFSDFCTMSSEQKQVAIAIASPIVRATIAKKLGDSGISLLSISSNSSVIMDCVDIGEGTLLSPFVTLTSNIRIGRCFHANLYSYVEHDCIIGDFVTFAPGVRCNGNVRIGDYAYVGSGAIIRQGINIGERATIGMGAVVTKDVAPGVTVIGNPARPLEKKRDA